MASSPHQDDRTILDDDDLWRRIRPEWFVFDKNLSAKRLSTAAFEDSSDGPMSVILVKEAGDPTTGLPTGFGVASLTAGAVRAQRQGVCRDPKPDEPAHALVFGWKPYSVQKALRKSAVLVLRPIDVP